MASHAGPLDTSPDAMRVQFDRFRAMSPAEKLTLVSDLTETANRLALAGLAQRFPHAGQSELLLRLAVLRLGAEAVEQAYGWREPPDGA